MGLFGFGAKKKEDSGNACIFCGMEIVNGVCTRCKREKKPMVDFSGMDFKRVPTAVAAELRAHKNPDFTSDNKTVADMIENGELFVADILIDSTSDNTRVNMLDDDELLNELFIQFSKPDGTPCSKCCEAEGVDGQIVEDSLKMGHREGLLLKGVKKKKEYYYAFIPQDKNLAKVLGDGAASALMNYGTYFENRRIAPKGMRDRIEFRREISVSFDDAQ